MKVEIGQFRWIDKGALKATFTLLIHPEGLQMSDCKYFSTEKSSWFNFPAKEIKKEGKSDFIPLVSYMNKEYLKDLREAVLVELKKEEEKNAKMRQGEHPSDQVQVQTRAHTDDLPF